MTNPRYPFRGQQVLTPLGFEQTTSLLVVLISCLRERGKIMVQKEQISRKTEEEEAQKWRVWLRGGTYVFGMLVLAMGLTLNTKAGLGVSPIISVPYSLSQIFSLDFGNTTLVFYILFVLVQIALHRGKAIWKDLLQVPLAIVFTRFLNLYAA